VQGHVDGVEDLLSIPSITNDARVRRYNANVSFADSTTAIVSDGMCSLHIVNTGDRSVAEKWTVSRKLFFYVVLSVAL
jgi:hypothetical protein